MLLYHFPKRGQKINEGREAAAAATSVMEGVFIFMASASSANECSVDYGGGFENCSDSGNILLNIH